MIRTRFAPSPTGFLHVGGIRTAQFAYLIAKHHDGKFILRFEDTDKKREVEGSRQHLIDSLRTLGIDYDEGPDIGGDYGPYVQSERLDIYRAWAQKLIDAGRAYADPYTPEQVQQFRQQAQAEKRAFLYRDHRPDNTQQLADQWDGSTPLRFKSDPKNYRWHDEVMGDLSTGPEVIDDFVIMKSDGYPTYNFAHIVDDAEMAITHVIRGQEFISSMPNYLNLYEALGFDMGATSGGGGETVNSLQGKPTGEGRTLPIFAHLPHIMNEQGNKKLGKRDGAKDVLDYVRDGYLPEALFSFIATLGWNDGSEQEVFSHQELIEKFSLDRIQRSGARFDERRLLWMNGQFIRQLSLDELADRVETFWPEAAHQADAAYRRDVLALAQARLKTLRDLPLLTSYFFDEPAIDGDLLTSNKQLRKLSPTEQAELLRAAADKLNQLTDWQPEPIQVALNQLLEDTDQKPGVLFSLIRIAITWAPFSPELDKSLALLGRDTSLVRLDSAIDFLD